MSSPNAKGYVGTELELFAQAHRWKAYLSERIGPHLGTDVLEVGAGIGTTTAALSGNHRGVWTCLEPDREQVATIARAIAAGKLAPVCVTRVGTLKDLPRDARFDSILYIDVLEHIDDDRAEVQRAAQHLREHGKLIVLAPAHQWLYSPFDRAIGHYRRYTRATLQALIPTDLETVVLQYLDCVGMLASAGNRFVHRSSAPTPSQIAVWDKLMVPASRTLDPLLKHRIGKSVLGVWQQRWRS